MNEIMAPPQHRYEVGQKLLCFEPDTSKAKVIYFAKILKQVENNKSTVPHYTVHFHGWKCKWDREVPENLLLENTDFNRTLKKRIDEIVHHERSRTRRKQRIDMVLKAAALAGDNLDWDNVPGVWIPKNKQERAESPFPCPQSPSDRTFSEKAASTVSEDMDSELMDNENVTQSQFENLQVHQLFSPSVSISDDLHGIIQSHCATPTGNTDPCVRGWCSVLQMLQSYVDNFPYAESQIPASLVQGKCSDRVFRGLNPAYAQTDQSRLMCADVCSSLRVLFDCMLDRYLLLPEEQALIGFRSDRFMFGGRAFPQCSGVPPTVSSMYQYCSPRYELFPESEAERRPHAPCLNYPAHFLLRLFVNLPEMLNAMNLTTCRRTIVTRHVYMLLDFLDRTRLWWFVHLVPRLFALPEPNPSDLSKVKNEQGPVTHKGTTVPVSETSSETEPQTTAEPIGPPMHHTSSRHVTRGSGPRSGISKPDSDGDSVTAIKLPISQTFTSPSQLEITVQTAFSPSVKQEDHTGFKRHWTSVSGTAKLPADNSQVIGRSLRSRPTLSINSRPQSPVRSIASTAERARLSPDPVSTDRSQNSETSSVKSASKTAGSRRTLRPRLSQVQYK